MSAKRAIMRLVPVVVWTSTYRPSALRKMISPPVSGSRRSTSVVRAARGGEPASPANGVSAGLRRLGWWRDAGRSRRWRRLHGPDQRLIGRTTGTNFGGGGCARGGTFRSPSGGMFEPLAKHVVEHEVARQRRSRRHQVDRREPDLGRILGIEQRLERIHDGGTGERHDQYYERHGEANLERRSSSCVINRHHVQRVDDRPTEKGGDDRVNQTIQRRERSVGANRADDRERNHGNR